METKYAIVSGLSLLLAFVFLILSGALYHSWWGLFVMVPWVCIPIFGAGCAGIAGDTDPSIKWNQFGYFFEAFFWVSLFGIPAVVHAVGSINGSQLAWIICSNILILVGFFSLAKGASE